MTRAFTAIAFTPSVEAVQDACGSRARNERLAQSSDRDDRLTRFEKDFIAARDGFYRATVGETGWPYVQYRGGLPGFVKVLDDRTIGYADFRGNVQYLSVGNLRADPRVALILMDYRAQRRLKIRGRARIVDATSDGDLLQRLRLPADASQVERGIVIAVEAFDWNCPQHITPRFTEAEVREATAPLVAELEALRAAPLVAELEALRAAVAVSGDGDRWDS